jgi:hypothetical protein
VNAKLIDHGCGAQDSERIEEVNIMPLFRETDGDGRSVDPSARDGNFCLHD